MSRKQSTVERIRKKKAAAPVPISDNDDKDPFHNGQTPSCRLLLTAVQDIFPELQRQVKVRTPSSPLGQLLRWQVLKRRKERSFPPVPPLHLASPSSSTVRETSEENGEHSPNVPSSASRKKKKKKKKKKDASVDSADLTSSKSEEAEETDKGSGQPATNGNENSRDREIHTCPSGDIGSSDVEIVSLKDKASNINAEPSLKSLDRSVNEHEEQRMMLETRVTPTLQSLPSDDAVFDYTKDAGNSSLSFFEQIQQESTEREDSEDFEMPLADEPSESIVTTPDQRKRALSSSSFASFDGVVTPTTKNTGEDTGGSNAVDEAPIKSPITHEWIPEDGAEAKTETPPGDVIKNPLDLPFLLTLSTDNGLTTTTIDGSLISAGKSDAEEHAPNSLETTKILMEEWMGQLLDATDELGANHRTENDINSFVRFMQSKLRNASHSLGIPFSELEGAVNDIDCNICRQDAMAVVDKWSERPEDKAIVLNPVVLFDRSPRDASDVDGAFDYVALEEGHHVPKAEPPDEEDGVDVDRAVHMSFSLSKPQTKKNGARNIYIHQVTQKHLISLIENWFPCGIEEEILVATSFGNPTSPGSGATGPEILSHKEASKLQRKVIERRQKAQEDLDELIRLRNDLHAAMDKIYELNDAVEQHVEFTSFPRMKNAEKLFIHFKDKIFDVLRLISRGKSDALVELKLQIWVSYLQALNKTLQACEIFYDRVGEEIADQRGVLPKIFLHAGFRNLFMTLLEEKVRVWSGLSEFICDQLKWRLLTEFYTRNVWHDERAPPIDKRALELDDECLELLKELAEWTDVAIGGRMAEIQRERMAKTEGMLEKLQNVVEPLAAEYASVEKYFSSERNHYFASLRSNVVLAQGVKNRMRLIDNAEVEHMTTGVILMWSHTRLMQSRMIHPCGIPSLPLQLKRWMLQDDSSAKDNWSSNDFASPLNSYHQRYCQAGQLGKRRAMCILAGVTYRWLEEECKAWKAEMAEKELLDNFDFGDNTIDSSSTKELASVNKVTKSKKGKKKRNKNNAVLPVDEDSSRTDDPTSLGANSNSIADLSHHNSSPSAEFERASKYEHQGDERHMQIVDSQTSEKQQNSVVQLPTLGAEDRESQSAQDVTCYTEDAPCPDVLTVREEKDKDSEVEEKYVELGVPFVSKVYVEDGKRRIQAGDYLIARMRDMLESKCENIAVIG